MTKTKSIVFIGISFVFLNIDGPGHRMPFKDFKEIIAVSFYSPPKSRKKSKLLDHLMTTIRILLTKFPNAGIIMGADRNDRNIASLLMGIPRVKQIVTEKTYKDKTHDIIITNLHQFYLPPVVVPPVAPDDPKNGVPSDHWMPIATPMSRNDQWQTKQYKTVQFAPCTRQGWIGLVNGLQMKTGDA